MDSKFKARLAPSEEAWMNNPSRYDLPDVDTPLTKHRAEIREAILKVRNAAENSAYTTKISKADIIWKAAGREFSNFAVEEEYNAMVKEGKLKAPKLRFSETTGTIRHKGELYSFFSAADNKEQAKMYARLAKVGKDDKSFIQKPDPKMEQKNWIVYRKIGKKPLPDSQFRPKRNPAERYRAHQDALKKAEWKFNSGRIRQQMIEQMELPQKPSIKDAEKYQKLTTFS